MSKKTDANPAPVECVVMPRYCAKVDRDTLERVLTHVVAHWMNAEARESYRAAIADVLAKLEASA